MTTQNKKTINITCKEDLYGESVDDIWNYISQLNKQIDIKSVSNAKLEFRIYEMHQKSDIFEKKVNELYQKICDKELELNNMTRLKQWRKNNTIFVTYVNV